MTRKYGQTTKLLFAIMLAALTIAPASGQERTAAPRGIAEADLIAALEGDGDWMAKQAACRELRIVGTEKCVPALLARLTDEELSHMVLYALENMAYEQVDQALRDALQKTSGSIKANIIVTIGVRGDAGSIDALAALLTDKDKRIRRAALTALANIGTPEAAKATAAFRDMPDEADRIEAARASLRLAERLAQQEHVGIAAEIYDDLASGDWPMHIRLGAFTGLLAADPENAERNIRKKILAKDLEENHPLKLTAIQAIADLKKPEHVSSFAKTLPDMPPAIQPLLIEVLAGHGGSDVSNGILAVGKQSQAPAVRAAAIDALGRIGDDAAIDWLIKQLKTVSPAENRSEYLSIEKALVTMRARGIGDKLIAAMKASEGAGRAALITVLMKRGQRSAARPLLEQARESDQTVAVAAWKALGILAGPAHLADMFDALPAAKSDEVRSAAELAIVRVARMAQAEEACADQAIALLESTDKLEQRKSLVRVIGALETAPSLKVLNQLILSSEQGELQDVALRQLVNWSDPSATQTLNALLAKTKNNTHRILALRAVVKLAGHKDLPPDRQLAQLKAALQHAGDAPSNIKLVLGGLGNTRSVEAVHIAGKYLTNDNVRTEAQVAINQILAQLKGQRLFNGKNLNGWEGDEQWFAIKDGAIVAGDLKRKIPRNQFLATKKPYTDFELTMKVKLLGENTNAGVQIRSQRIPDHHEMIGYQADLGQKYWGVLYDESRRRKILAGLDWEKRQKLIKQNDWNDYRIRCLGKRVELWLNGVKTADYTEADGTIEQAGLIAVQIHSGAPGQAWYKDIVIKNLAR